MNQPFRSAPVEKTAVQPKQILVELFDYATLDDYLAQQVLAAAQRIRQKVKQTLEHIFVIGQELIAVKQALPHGRFGPWLRAEFGWSERTARNFMTVVQRFGPKSEIISDLPIDATAAYLLARLSMPEEVCQIALRRAEHGEHITVDVVREILGSVRKQKQVPQQEAETIQPRPKLRGRLLAVLESFRRECNSYQVSELARQLRAYAEYLEEV
jgi:hypothetical protein